ncbi:MAG: RNA repair domain-containing protein, partial [Catenulispora sp.]
MRTSQEIYHRVRWDARFDASRFVLGVEQRGREPKRVPLPSFDPRGEIPWHRVVFFEADGELVWDRASGLDALDASGAGLARRERVLPAPFFEARTPHVFTAGRWRPAPDAAPRASAASQIKVLTWNTLWDRYDGDLIQTDRRRPMLLAELAALAASDVDVIALQEVEPPLLKMLLAEPWVREGWTLGGDPRSSDVADSGLVLLSRLPVVEAGWHALARYKAITAMVVETATGPVVVANTHLSSDHSANGAGLRDAQLGQLADGLGAIDEPLVLVGDFNDDSDAPATRLGLTDAWVQVHGPDDQTPTFDPTVNPLAAVSSLSGEARRLDRVLLRGWQASAAQLIGDAADTGGLFVSDHYGLAVTAYAAASAPPPSPTLEVRPTARTAVAWIPPGELWDDIQELRRRLDPQIRRWPPHVNILFGFVPESEYDAALPWIGKAAATIPPFEVRLGTLRHFRHRSDSTLWLDPEGDGWSALHAALLERFPACRSRDEFVPHLTVGKVADPARSVVKLAPVATRVRELALLSRRGDEPMCVRAVVTLGTGQVRWLDPDADSAVIESVTGGPRLDAEATALADRVRTALPEAAIHIVGSRRFEVNLPGADLDLVAAVPGAPDADLLQRRVTEAVGP